MRSSIILFGGVLLALVCGSSAHADCTGGVGSTSLSCSSTSGTLANYKTWVETDYAPSSVNTLMSSFAAVFDPGNLKMTGWGQVYDTWGASGAASKTVQYSTPDVVPYYVASSSTTPKASSSFLIDGNTFSSNGANVYLELSWTGTVAHLIDGVTEYVASYTYAITSAGAWGANVANGNQNWLTGSYFSSSGSGTYNFSAATVAVPGPEAGVGLGALVLGGLIFATTRRRQFAIASN